MKVGMIGQADSYKGSHWPQYPPGTDGYYGYGESRGGEYSETVVIGGQPYIMDLVENPVTKSEVEFYKELYAEHGEPFNYDGWMDLVNRFGGLPPIRIQMVPEGTVLPTKLPIYSVESTDKALFWLGSYMETALLRAIW